MNRFFIHIPYSSKEVQRHSTWKKFSVLLCIRVVFLQFKVPVTAFARSFPSISSGERESNSSLFFD